VASACALSLAVGGTLMLFTAQSETATNVVTLGGNNSENGQGIVAQEKGPNDTAFRNVVASEGGFRGINFGMQMPGTALVKETRFVNTGNFPLYVKVEGEVTFTDVSGKTEAAMAWDDIIKIVNSVVEDKDMTYPEGATNDDKQELKNYAFLNKVLPETYTENGQSVQNISKNWFGAPVTVKNETVDGISSPHFYGTWYYVELDETSGKATGTLAKLGIDETDDANATKSIFKKVFIPADLDNDAQGCKIQLRLTGYGIQSDNVDGSGGITAWQELFTGAKFDVITKPQAAESSGT
jgi:predicted ribosomally synthesized peptide with SipW-like signal peptide